MKYHFVHNLLEKIVQNPLFHRSIRLDESFRSVKEWIFYDQYQESYGQNEIFDFPNIYHHVFF